MFVWLYEIQLHTKVVMKVGTLQKQKAKQKDNKSHQIRTGQIKVQHVHCNVKTILSFFNADRIVHTQFYFHPGQIVNQQFI